MNNLSINRITVFALLAALLAVGTATANVDAQAAQTASQNYENGMFSITRSQTVRLHVLNRAIPAGLTFTFQVLDKDRNVLGESEREQVVGQGRALSFDFSTLGDRTDVHVLVNVRGRSIQEYKPGFTATVEVIDTASGKTDLLAGGMEPSP
ncbi:MAG TPA: hypothetical protein VII12_19820 [Thermoanaerobaculia bacterium]